MTETTTTAIERFDAYADGYDAAMSRKLRKVPDHFSPRVAPAWRNGWHNGRLDLGIPFCSDSRRDHLS